MKKIVTLTALASALLASGLTQAATTTELKVTGVIRPAACAPSFTGGGTVDYGVIPPNTLSTTAPTVLAEKTVPFTVACDAATKMSLKVTDNRKASMVAGLANNVSYAGLTFNDALAFGLGTAAGKNIGAYVMRMVPSSVSADGTSPDTIVDTTGSGNWAKISAEGGFKSNNTYPHSFAVAGTVVPAAYKTVSGNLGVTAVIDKTSNLDLTSDVTLDGSATIEVVYL